MQTPLDKKMTVQNSEKNSKRPFLFFSVNPGRIYTKVSQMQCILRKPQSRLDDFIHIVVFVLPESSSE